MTVDHLIVHRKGVDSMSSGMLETCNELEVASLLQSLDLIHIIANWKLVVIEVKRTLGG